MFPIFGALQIILLLNRMSNAQSLEAPGRKRPMIHITAQALGPPAFAVEISPPPPTNMPPLTFPPLQSVQTTKPPSISSSPPALYNHSEDVDPSIKIPSVKDPSDQGPSVNARLLKARLLKALLLESSWRKIHLRIDRLQQFPIKQSF